MGLFSSGGEKARRRANRFSGQFIEPFRMQQWLALQDFMKLFQGAFKGGKLGLPEGVNLGLGSGESEKEYTRKKRLLQEDFDLQQKRSRAVDASRGLFDSGSRRKREELDRRELFERMDEISFAEANRIHSEENQWKQMMMQMMMGQTPSPGGTTYLGKSGPSIGNQLLGMGGQIAAMWAMGAGGAGMGVGGAGATAGGPGNLSGGGSFIVPPGAFGG